MPCILNPLVSRSVKRDLSGSGQINEEAQMHLKRVDGPRQVTLPDGSILSRADLPPPETRRWVASRKAVVVKAVTSGLITRSEALDRYALSEEELSLWFGAVEQHGEVALKVTTIQKYRKSR
jgi:Protein of unknown function (DUF1153)